MAKPVRRISTEALVARIRRLRSVSGTSFAEIAQALNAEGIVSQRGTAWTGHDVSTFISTHINTEPEPKSNPDFRPKSAPAPKPEFLGDVPETITLELTPAALAALGGDKPPVLSEAIDFSLDSTIQLATEMVEDITTVVDEPPQPRHPPAADSPNDLAVLVQSFKSGELSEMIKWFRSESGPCPQPAAESPRPSFAGPTKSVTLEISAPVMAGALRKMVEDRKQVGTNFAQLVEVLLWRYQGSPASLVIDSDRKE
jgi:hypothetical protein